MTGNYPKTYDAYKSILQVIVLLNIQLHSAQIKQERTNIDLPDTTIPFSFIYYIYLTYM